MRSVPRCGDQNGPDIAPNPNTITDEQCGDGYEYNLASGSNGCRASPACVVKNTYGALATNPVDQDICCLAVPRPIECTSTSTPLLLHDSDCDLDDNCSSTSATMLLLEELQVAGDDPDMWGQYTNMWGAGLAKGRGSYTIKRFGGADISPVDFKLYAAVEVDGLDAEFLARCAAMRMVSYFVRMACRVDSASIRFIVKFPNRDSWADFPDDPLPISYLSVSKAAAVFDRAGNYFYTYTYGHTDNHVSGGAWYNALVSHGLTCVCLQVLEGHGSPQQNHRVPGPYRCASGDSGLLESSIRPETRCCWISAIRRHWGSVCGLS